MVKWRPSCKIKNLFNISTRDNAHSIIKNIQGGSKLSEAICLFQLLRCRLFAQFSKIAGA